MGSESYHFRASVSYGSCLKLAKFGADIESIRNELWHVFASVLIDYTSSTRCGLPSAVSPKAAKNLRRIKIKTRLPPL